MILAAIPMSSGSNECNKNSVNNSGSFGSGSHLEFQNGRQAKTTFGYILVSETRISMILVTIHMCSESSNTMRTMPTALDHLVESVILNGRHSKQLQQISQSLKAVDE